MMETLTDDEWEAVQADLRANVEAFYDAYKHTDDRNQEVRKETEDYVIFADASGQELSEIAEINDVDRSALSSRMHKEARKRYDVDGAGDAWSVADPIVVLKDGGSEA